MRDKTLRCDRTTFSAIVCDHMETRLKARLNNWWMVLSDAEGC